MSESAKLSKSDFPLPMLADGTVWTDWEPQFLTHLGLHGLKKYFPHADAAAFENSRKSCDDPGAASQHGECCGDAGYASTVGT